MTRSHIDSPVWVWSCDRCGRKDVTHLAVSQQSLPSPDEMRTRGWFIADQWGDRCPWCVAESAGADG